MSNCSPLKMRIFARNQGEAETQAAGMQPYGEDLRRGRIADTGGKAFYKTASPHLRGSACGIRRWIAPLLALLVLLGSTQLASSETRLEGQIHEDMVWDAAQSPFRLTGLLTVPSGATVTITSGVVVLFDKNSRLEVKGTLMAGETVFDGAADINNREKIRFLPGSRGRLTHCAVENLEIECRSSEVLVTGSAISNRNGSGITVGKTYQPTIVRNDFLRNSYYAVYKEGQATLRAPNNYWGAADGPSGAGGGKGDAVNPSVDFMPYEKADMGEHLFLVERELENTTLRPGSSASLTYVIANLNSFDHNAILGASIYSDPAHHIHSPADDLAVTIKPGHHRYTRSFAIPGTLPEGRYTVLWGVMKTDLTAYYALEKDPDALHIGSVEPVLPPPPVTAPGWVPVKKSRPF